MRQPAGVRIRILEAMFTGYRRFLSPLLHSPALVRGGCPYQPTCSEYAELALAQHGILRGGALALWRLLRCNPFSHGGWDPVPIPTQRGSRNTV